MTRARILADYVSGGTTAAEFDYLDGVTSNVQTQLDAKSPTTGHANIATVGTVATGTWEGTDVAVAHGGTGASTHTANNVLIGAGTSAITSVAPGADGQVLTSTGTVWQSEAVAAGGGVVKVTYFTPSSFDVASHSTSTPSESSSIAITMTSGNRILLTWSGVLYVYRANGIANLHMGVTGTNMTSAASVSLETPQCQLMKASDHRGGGSQNGLGGDTRGADTYMGGLSTTILCPVVNATSASYNIFTKGGVSTGGIAAYFGRQTVIAQEIDISVIT